ERRPPRRGHAPGRGGRRTGPSVHAVRRGRRRPPRLGRPGISRSVRCRQRWTGAGRGGCVPGAERRSVFGRSLFSSPSRKQALPLIVRARSETTLLLCRQVPNDTTEGERGTNPPVTTTRSKMEFNIQRQGRKWNREEVEQKYHKLCPEKIELIEGKM